MKLDCMAGARNTNLYFLDELKDLLSEYREGTSDDEADESAVASALETAVSDINDFLSKCLQGADVVSVGGLNLENVGKVEVKALTEQGKMEPIAALLLYDKSGKRFGLYYLAQENKYIGIDFGMYGLRRLYVG